MSTFNERMLAKDAARERRAMERENFLSENYAKQGLSADANRHSRYASEAGSRYDMAMAKYQAEATANAIASKLK